jgi:hypothetical protein
MSDQPLTVVRIIAPDFVVTFETTDGVVWRADSAIAYLVGWSDDEVREFVDSRAGRHAAIISGGPIRVIQHWERFEVLSDGKRKRFFFDTSAFRRGRQASNPTVFTTRLWD